MASMKIICECGAISSVRTSSEGPDKYGVDDGDWGEKDIQFFHHNYERSYIYCTECEKAFYI